jgi:stage IV sporulation protein FB
MKKIPVKIAPSFFVMAFILGFLNTFSLVGTLIWAAVIFISVLVHEYGHAIAATFFGQSAQIQLFAFGGLTLPQGKKLKGWQEFTVIAMGPLFGFGLYFATLFIPLDEVSKLETVGPLLAYFILVTQFINLFWTVINLIPILPLDGGHLLRILLQGFIGHKSWKVSFILSVILSAVASLGFFYIGQLFIGVVFLLFTFQSVETLRQFRNFTKEDLMDSNRGKMDKANQMMKEGDIQSAKKCLETLLYSTHEGMIHTLAKENLARIAFNQGEKEKSYQLLLSEEKNLSLAGRLLFYEVCFHVEDFARVISLAHPTFDVQRDSKTAIIAAIATSYEKKASEAIEWLTRAKIFGEVDILKVIEDKAFDQIRSSEEFKKFLIDNGG